MNPYQSGEFGGVCADIGCNVITSLEECRTAITSHGITISSEWTAVKTTYPYGCSLGGSTLHFNTNVDGVARSSEKPFCYCPGKLRFMQCAIPVVLTLSTKKACFVF